MPHAASRDQLDSRLRNQFGLLTTQFLLGMAVNLIGLPDQTTGFAHLSSVVLLILHVLVAIGLVVGAGQIIRLADQAGPVLRIFSRTGALGIGIAVLGGILTMAAPGTNWWSYLMAIGFIGAMISYGRFWVLAASRR